MVTIKELPDGLELRSTSRYEIDAKMKELTGPITINFEGMTVEAYMKKYNLGPPPFRAPDGYEFIEDHIERNPAGTCADKDGKVWPQEEYFEHVITLKKI